MKKDVLIIDDDEVFNFLTQRVIEAIGFANNIRTALNGIEALESLKESISCNSLPDLILLDINMPLMNGFEFLENLKCSDFPNKEKICIAILSSSSNSSDIEMANQYGIKYYFTKPLLEDDLQNLLKKEFYSL